MPAALSERQILGIGLIAAGALMRGEPIVHTRTVKAPPRGIAKVLTELIDKIEEAVQEALAEVDEALRLAQEAYNQLSDLHQDLMDLLAGLNELDAALLETMELINAMLTTTGDLEEDLRTALDVLAQLENQVRGPALQLITALRGLLDQALSRIQELETQLAELRRRVQDIATLVQTLARQMQDISNAFNAALQTLSSLMDNLKSMQSALDNVIATVGEFLYWLEEVEVTIEVRAHQSNWQASFKTHADQTAWIKWELDVWPSLFHCASAWVQVKSGNSVVFQRYNRSCCSCCGCWEACTEAPGCHQASRGEAVGGETTFSLPKGDGIIQAFGGDDQSDRSDAKGTLKFRTIRLFVS